MGNCQACGQGLNTPNSQCSYHHYNRDHHQQSNCGDGLPYSQTCIDRKSDKKARKLAAYEAKCQLAQQAIVDVNGVEQHSAKWYKLRAKQQKLACKMAKADAGCRC